MIYCRQCEHLCESRNKKEQAAFLLKHMPHNIHDKQ